MSRCNRIQKMSSISAKSRLANLEILQIENSLKAMVILPPPKVPLWCFPEVVSSILDQLFPKEWRSLSLEGQQYVQGMSAKLEMIDQLFPTIDPSLRTQAVELLALDEECSSFAVIEKNGKTLKIAPVLIRFATIIVALMTIRVFRHHLKKTILSLPDLIFTQNIDTHYLDYIDELKAVFSVFPEYENLFYLEINEKITTDYLETIRDLSSQLKIPLVLDDSNKMNAFVHWKLLDLADWIKIDFQATRSLEERLIEGHGEQILLHFQRYAQNSKTAAIVFEGLQEDSLLKKFLLEFWNTQETSIYYQSRERLPSAPWDQCFGLLQDHIENEFGLYFRLVT